SGGVRDRHRSPGCAGSPRRRPRMVALRAHPGRGFPGRCVPRARRWHRGAMRKTLVIARRELASMFGGPLAWILGAVFAVLTGYFFYSDLTFYVLFGGAELSSGLWRYVFLDYRMVAMLVVPLITMRLLAEERKLGTLELLWTFPVREREVVAGKFLAALAAYALMLVPTLAGPAALAVMHPFSPGPLVAGYIGMLLLGAAFIACG